MDDLEGHPGSKEQYRSQGERELARFFRQYGIRYAYENPVLVTDGGKRKIWYPDFHLPDFAAYVEYYGLSGNPDYDLQTKHKTAAYHASGLAVVPVYPCTLGDGLEGYMTARLAEIQRSRAASLADLYRRIEHVDYSRSWAQGRGHASFPSPPYRQGGMGFRPRGSYR